MSPATPKKDCGNHKGYKFRKLLKRVAAVIIIIIVLVLLAVLITWLVLRPTKPRFTLQDANVQTLNLTTVGVAGANLLFTTMQVTVASRNPNDRIGVKYALLAAHAEYKGQRLTLATALPPVYQGEGSVVAWSPYLSGYGVPVAPYVAAALTADEGAGFLLIMVKLDGRVRWRVGGWSSGHYHIYVECPALLEFQDGRATGVAPSLRFRQVTTCSVDV